MMSPMTRRLRDKESGFTVLEILFVVVILATLILIAVASYYFTTGRARATACRATQRILQDGVVSYQADNDGDLPDSLDEIDDYVHRPQDEIDDGITYDPDTGEVSCTYHP